MKLHFQIHSDNINIFYNLSLEIFSKVPWNCPLVLIVLKELNQKFLVKSQVSTRTY